MDPTLRAIVERRLALEIRAVRRIDDGWDYVVFEVNGDWIVRVARRSEVREWLSREAALLPFLAESLPIPVPQPVAVDERGEPAFMVYRRLEGEPLSTALGDHAVSLARQLGEFLAALHGLSPGPTPGVAAIDHNDWLAAQQAFARRCESVFPLLDDAERRRARALFDRHVSRPPEFELAVVHGDLGPEHILARRDVVTGVIDWSDARFGDPALDFAWLLHVPADAFAEALLGGYAAAGGRVDPLLRERARYFHQVGPWHEVLHGLEHGRSELIESGLAGVRARLP